MNQAIVVSDPKVPAPLTTFDLKKLVATVPVERSFRGGRRFTKNGELRQDWHAPLRWRIPAPRAAAADRRGDESPRMVLKLDDRKVESFHVKSERKSSGLVRVRQRTSSGAIIGWRSRFTNDIQRSERRERSPPRAVADVSRSSRSRGRWAAPLRGAAGIAPADFHCPAQNGRRLDAGKSRLRPGDHRSLRQPRVSPPGDGRRDRAADEALVELADQEWRAVRASIRMTLEAVLVSPHFLFRVETDPPSRDKPRRKYRISDYELATRLSYFLWSSMPDDELFDLCRKGTLRERRPSRSASAADAEGSEGAGPGRQFRRPMAANAAAGRHDARIKRFSGIRRRASRGDDDKETELFFLHVMTRRSQRHGFPRRRLHLGERTAGEAVWHPRTLPATSSAACRSRARIAAAC